MTRIVIQQTICESLLLSGLIGWYNWKLYRHFFQQYRLGLMIDSYSFGSMACVLNPWFAVGPKSTVCNPLALVAAVFRGGGVIIHFSSSGTGCLELLTGFIGVFRTAAIAIQIAWAWGLLLLLPLLAFPLWWGLFIIAILGEIPRWMHIHGKKTGFA